MSLPTAGGVPAARTNVRPLPAAATHINTGYCLGGATVPSTAPVAVAATTARPGFSGRATKYRGTLANTPEEFGPVPTGRRIRPEMPTAAIITAATAAAAAPGRSHPGQRRGPAARRTRPGARQPLPAARLRGGMRPWAARSSLRRAASTTSGPGGGSASSRWTPLSSSMGLLLPAPGGSHGVRRAVAVFRVGAAERLSQPRPCPAQPRAHGAIGNAKRQGDLLVVQASDGHQQQHVPVAAAQPGQRGGQGRPGSRGTDSLSDQVLITGCYSL